jgi:hypothetical protein
MPGRKTVFVIGAGASNEADLPISAELKTSIAAALDIRFDLANRLERGDYKVVEALRLAVAAEDPPARDIRPYVHAAWQICKAMPLDTSIDNFINTHPGDAKIELCGKLAIVRTILAAEGQPAVRRPNAARHRGLQPTRWNMVQYLFSHAGRELHSNQSQGAAIFNRVRDFQLRPLCRALPV